MDPIGYLALVKPGAENELADHLARHNAARFAEHGLHNVCYVVDADLAAAGQRQELGKSCSRRAVRRSGFAA